MHVLILQHENSTPPGSTLQWCEERKASFQVLTPSDIRSWPAPAHFDLLVICGGSMNVDQEDQFPWLKEEKKLIHQALEAKKKIVGLCLGGQLIAEALGARVGKHPHWEVGWQKVQLRNGNRLDVFQWHGYSFDLPPGAELLATNEICKYQAFSYQDHVLGFQFHPETTKEWALQCSQSPRLPTTGFVQTKEEIQRDLHFQPELQAWYFKQLDEFMGTAPAGIHAI